MKSKTINRRCGWRSTAKKPSNAKFALFPKLPIELRLVIWSYSMPGPRFIQLQILAQGPKLDVSPRNPPKMSLRAISATVPSLLRTCKESREEAKKFYELGFEHHLRSKPIYFNFERDFVVITHSHQLVLLVSGGFNDQYDGSPQREQACLTLRGKIQNIAVRGSFSTLRNTRISEFYNLANLMVSDDAQARKKPGFHRISSEDGLEEAQLLGSLRESAESVGLTVKPCVNMEYLTWNNFSWMIMEEAVKQTLYSHGNSDNIPIVLD